MDTYNKNQNTFKKDSDQEETVPSLDANSRVRNKHSPTLINLLTFFQGLRSYSGLHRAYLGSIIIRYKWGYAYSL